jgi:hypothetical protein
MMKVLSLVLTIALLIFADRLAGDLKRAGALPATKKELQVPAPNKLPWPFQQADTTARTGR